MARTDGLWEIVDDDYIQPVGSRDILIIGSGRYLNFGFTSGELGRGFRDNGGDMEYKDDGGSWTKFSSLGGGGSVLMPETPSGTVNGSNNTFTVNNDPVFIVVDDMIRTEGNGYTYSAPTITVDELAPPTSFIESFYNT